MAPQFENAMNSITLISIALLIALLLLCFLGAWIWDRWQAWRENKASRELWRRLIK